MVGDVSTRLMQMLVDVSRWLKMLSDCLRCFEKVEDAWVYCTRNKRRYFEMFDDVCV